MSGNTSKGMGNWERDGNAEIVCYQASFTVGSYSQLPLGTLAASVHIWLHIYTTELSHQVWGSWGIDPSIFAWVEHYLPNPQDQKAGPQAAFRLRKACWQRNAGAVNSKSSHLLEIRAKGSWRGTNKLVGIIRPASRIVRSKMKQCLRKDFFIITLSTAPPSAAQR
jgi:hypothetical protein